MLIQISRSAGTTRPAHAPAPGYVCSPGPKGVAVALRQVWEFRRLLYVFVWRDLRVRYRHTAIGVGWNLLQPLGYLAVFSLVFGLLAPERRTSDLPYPLFLYPGLLLWQLFGRLLTQGGASLDAFKPLLCRVFFPRLIAPLSASLGVFVDFGVACSALAVLMVAYGAWPGWSLLLAPLFVLWTLVLGLGCALWLAALDILYKDVRHTLPFLTQVWMFASPVVYPVALVPEPYRGLYCLNPVVGLIEGFRFAVLPGAAAPTPFMLSSSVALGLVLLASGVLYFNAREGTLVDSV